MFGCKYVGPNSMPDTASVGCSKIDDVLHRVSLPTHSRLLESLVEDDLTPGLGDPATNWLARGPTFGVVHVGSVLFQITEPTNKVVAFAFESTSSLLLRRTSDYFRYAIDFTPQNFSTLFCPTVRLLSIDAKETVTELGQVLTSVKEINAPTPISLYLQTPFQLSIIKKQSIAY